jgi:hypothetical protein
MNRFEDHVRADREAAERLADDRRIQKAIREIAADCLLHEQEMREGKSRWWGAR